MRISALAAASKTVLPTSRIGGYLLGGLLASALLSGCALNSGNSVTGSTGVATAISFQGKLYGGQQAVSGANVQLYTVNTAAVGGASTALIAGNGVITDAAGGFGITATYNCTSATQVYIVATGGNSGSGVNSSLSLMTALGPCTSLLPTSFIMINELTTVAGVYALAPYMVDYKHVGAVGSNPTGLVNAFKTANLLVNSTVGTVGPAPTGVTLPAAELNTLGNMLAACINTTGSASVQCTSLYGATGATETIGAALYIAKNPGLASLTSLYTLGSASAPFVPGLQSQPKDFTVAVKYAGAELLGPYGIALDANGSAWITNESGRSVVKAPSPSSSFATTTYSVGGLLAPRGVSIDRTGNIWIANTGGNNVVELNSSGTVLSAAGFTGGGISAPVAIANDSAGNAWVANFNGNSLTELGTTGTASGASPITGTNALSLPTSVALDASGRVLVGNSGTGQVCIFSNAAALQSCAGDGALFGATSIAVSKSGNVALAGSTTGSAVAGAFTLATSTGTIVAGSPGSAGGLVIPTAVAYDGVGNAFFANTGSISQFSGLTAVSPAAGFGTLSAPAGIAVDNSGNVWTTNAGDNSVSIFIGLGTPAVTPLAANVGP